MPSQARDASENIASTRTSLNFPSRLDVNTPAFAPRDPSQSTTRTESPEQFNSQLWRIQKENTENHNTQVELLKDDRSSPEAPSIRRKHLRASKMGKRL